MRDYRPHAKAQISVSADRKHENSCREIAKAQRATSKENVAPGFHSGEGGVNPTVALIAHTCIMRPVAVLEKSEIYDGRRQVFFEWENQILSVRLN
jgi:hypothetical protein